MDLTQATVAIPAMDDDAAVLREVLVRIGAAAPRVPVVVVDMSSRDLLRRVCDEADVSIRYDHFPESGGVSHSRNRAVDLAETRFVAFVDSDCFVEPGWLEAQLACLQDDRTAVVGARILPAFESRPPRLFNTVTARHWLSLLDLGPQPLEIPMVVGTSYALDRTRVGAPPFDESLGRRPGWALAMEENALCLRARAAGWRVMYEPASVVRHRIPASRATWRWMWRRAYTAGRETRIAGRSEPMPSLRLGLRDRLFQAATAPAFYAGMATRPAKRPS